MRTMFDKISPAALFSTYRRNEVRCNYIDVTGSCVIADNAFKTLTVTSGEGITMKEMPWTVTTLTLVLFLFPV